MAILKSKYSHKTIIVFLQTRKWEKVEETEYGVYLSPPDYIKFSEPNFKWYIPTIVTSTYNRKMELVIEEISKMYEISKDDLVELFSKPFETVRKEVLLMKDMLEFV